MVKLHLTLGPIPAMMNALERTAVSVTSDGRTERGPILSQPWSSETFVPLICRVLLLRLLLLREELL